MISEASARDRWRQSVQIRRAWFLLVLCLVVFSLAALTIIVVLDYARTHATTSNLARLEIVSGSGGLWRSSADTDWKLIDGEIDVSEGDQISTALGTVAWITLFDGSTVEVSEGSVVNLTRMRSSRFTNRTKLIELEPERGTLYLAMAPRGAFNYSELIVKTEFTNVTMADSPIHADAGAFLVELVSNGEPEVQFAEQFSVRTAVIRGAVVVDAREQRQTLYQNQQTIVDPEGVIGPITEPFRQFIFNGTFQHGLAAWETFNGLAPTASPQIPGSVNLVNVDIHGAPENAVELVRLSGAANVARSGIRQRIGQTLRANGSLVLELDARVSVDRSSEDNPQYRDYPLNVELRYVDLNGNDQSLVRSYYLLTESGAGAPSAAASPLDPGTWERIVLELDNLSPVPRQLTELVVYASGMEYQTLVANLSLTSRE